MVRLRVVRHVNLQPVQGVSAVEKRLLNRHRVNKPSGLSVKIRVIPRCDPTGHVINESKGERDVRGVLGSGECGDHGVCGHRVGGSVARQACVARAEKWPQRRQGRVCQPFVCHMCAGFCQSVFSVVSQDADTTAPSVTARPIRRQTRLDSAGGAGTPTQGPGFASGP